MDNRHDGVVVNGAISISAMIVVPTKDGAIVFTKNVIARWNFFKRKWTILRRHLSPIYGASLVPHKPDSRHVLIITPLIDIFICVDDGVVSHFATESFKTFRPHFVFGSVGEKIFTDRGVIHLRRRCSFQYLNTDIPALAWHDDLTKFDAHDGKTYSYDFNTDFTEAIGTCEPVRLDRSYPKHKSAIKVEGNVIRFPVPLVSEQFHHLPTDLIRLVNSYLKLDDAVAVFLT